MLTFPQQPSLNDLQTYIADMCREHGFDKAENLETFLLFVEEVGEMAKAIRDHRGLFQEGDPKQDHLAEEMADVLSYLLDLANRYHVNLAEALRLKEEKNSQRTWK